MTDEQRGHASHFKMPAAFCAYDSSEERSQQRGGFPSKERFGVLKDGGWLLAESGREQTDS
jgi:hypothetical protein